MQNEMKSPKAGRVIGSKNQAGRDGGRGRSADGDRMNDAGPNCPQCGGTGWRIVERAGMSGAARCDCASLHRARRHCSTTRTSRPITSARRSIISLCRRIIRSARTGLGMALRQAIGFARDFPAVTPPGLLLIGDPGTGKTHLAVGVMKALLEKGHECVFFDYQNLLDRIRSELRRGLRHQRSRSVSDRARCRRAAARRPGRASRHRVGGRHRDVDHHLSLQSSESR